MNQIHPSAVIGDGVVLGTGNRIGPYVVIIGDVQLGDDNWIGPMVTIGTPPEVRAAEHPAAWSGDGGGGRIEIGNRNVLREYLAVQAGYAATTRIGDGCYLQSKSHVAHDCVLGDGVTLSTGAVLAGHTHVGAGANFGLNATAHQGMIIGPGAMLGMGAVVTHFVPPHALAYGVPARVHGVNRVGMRRLGIPEPVVDALAAQYASDGAATDAQAPEMLADDFEWWRRELAAAQG